MENDIADTSFKTFNSSVITDDIRRIAETELNEKENEISVSIATLKELLKRENDLVPCTDDAFLLMFLRARKFKHEAALNLMKKYYSACLKYPSMFKNYTPRACTNVMKANLHYFLPYRSPEGCAVLLSKFGQWDPRVLSCADLLKFNIMCNEMAIQNPVTQICGVITIADMKDFSWSHLLHIPISDVRCFVNTLQDCLPIRDKAIHIIHHSNIFSILFALVKPLLSEKIKERIYFHGDDLNSLHQYLPPDILPRDLGGKLSSLPNQDFYDSLVDSNELFSRKESFGYLD